MSIKHKYNLNELLSKSGNGDGNGDGSGNGWGRSNE